MKISADIWGKAHLVDCGVGQTLLAAFKEHGVEVPYACEGGTCGSCICQVVEGNVTMRHNEVLCPDEVADGYALACQAVPDACDVSVIYD